MKRATAVALLLSAVCFAAENESPLSVKVLEAGFIPGQSVAGTTNMSCTTIGSNTDCSGGVVSRVHDKFFAWVDVGDGREYQIGCGATLGRPSLRGPGQCRRLRAGDLLKGYWDTHGNLILLGHGKPDGGGKLVKGAYAVIGSRIKQP